MTVGADAIDLDQLAARTTRTGLLFGTEGTESRARRAVADVRVRIPMDPGVTRSRGGRLAVAFYATR